MLESPLDTEVATQVRFENLLSSKFPSLEAIKKWNQTMWHKEGKLIVSLIFLSQRMKFCFFNNPNLELDKLQRWSSSVYSQNLLVENVSVIDWSKVENAIGDTIAQNKTS